MDGRVRGSFAGELGVQRLYQESVSRHAESYIGGTKAEVSYCPRALLFHPLWVYVKNI